MLKFRFDYSRTTSQGLLAVCVCLFMSACATQQTKDSSIDENIEVMKQLEEMEQSSAAVLVEQDLGLLSLHERNEKEALRNLQNELGSDALRLPATQEDAQPEVQKVEPTNMPLNEKLSEKELSQQLFEADSVTVQKGDSMSTIAQARLGNAKAWPSIWAINPNIQNPNTLEVGTKLYVPHSSNEGRSLASTSEASAPSTAPVKDKVEVKQETQAAASSASSPTSNATPKKIPALKPKVEFKIEKAQPKVSLGPSLSKDKVPAITVEDTKVKEEAPAQAAAPTHSPNLTTDAIESAFSVVGTATSHTTDELLQEHLDIKRAHKYKGKKAPETLQRKISSVNDQAPEEVATSSTPKGLSKLVSLVGFLLLAGVIAGFIFSKPSKIQ